MSSTRDAIEFARRSHGLITAHEAAALGMAASTLSRRVEQGVFVRVRPGLFALPGSMTRPDFRLRAACLVLGGVVSHESAALMHQFRPITVRRPNVTVSHRSTHMFAEMKVHQSTDLAEAHVIRKDGLRVTTPTRTIVDLAKVTPTARLARVIDNAVVDRSVDMTELIDLFSSLARKGKPGVRKLRTLLEERSGGPVVTESELEVRLLRLISDAGLPTPESQFRPPWLKPINGRIDFAYLTEKIVIEADGRRWHAAFDAFETDRLRDNAAQVKGWRVLRFTWRMLEDDPITVVSTIRNTLAS